MASPALPMALPSAATASASVKAALPALTVMLVDGAINLVAAIIILAIGWTLSRWVLRWSSNALAEAQFVDATLKPLIAKFISYGILAVTVVAVLGQFGVQTTSLIALLGAAGLAVGLALQGTLSNVASGVMLLVLRPFRVGEQIKVADVLGRVREVGLFRTMLVTDEGLFVSVPNSTIFSGVIVNTSRERIRRTSFTVDIDHREDIAAVRQHVLRAVTAAPQALQAPAPEVEVHSINGTSILLSVQVWVKNVDFLGQQSQLRIIVRKALTEAAVNPPIPMLGVAQPHAGESLPQPASPEKPKPN